jgi:mRNA interferase RelE/StbE
MSFHIEYHQSVVEKDIPKLDSVMKSRIKEVIFAKLTEKPELFGVHLRNELKGYWKLRIGDYRVVFSIREDRVRILAIQHRSTVYKLVLHRLGL